MNKSLSWACWLSFYIIITMQFKKNSKKDPKYHRQSTVSSYTHELSSLLSQSRAPRLEEKQYLELASQREQERRGKEGQKGLTEEERKLVGDIGKLFKGESSKPAKLLIRLNQTQKRADNVSPMGNRLEKIEVTRIEQGNRGEDKELLPSIMNACLSPPNEQADHPQSQINIWHEDQSQVRKRVMQICRQVAIMFTPELTLSSVLAMKNPPPLFTRFGKKQQRGDGARSSLSNDLLQEKGSKENDLAPESSNFVKLMEIQLFLRRKEVRHQRSEELRHANEKLLAAHLSSKQELQRTHETLKKSEAGFKKKLEELAALLQEQKQQNKQLKLQLQTKQQSLQTVNRLKEQYAMENNNLKQKIKEHIKIIHELKLEATRAVEAQLRPPQQQPKPQKKIQESNNLQVGNDYGHSSAAKSERREITFHALNQQPHFNQYFYHPIYYATEADEREHVKSNEGKRGLEMKLANCRSQILLARDDIEKGGIPAGDQTSRSQKAVGIKKNTPSQQPISPSTRNLVRVSKNAVNDASVLMGEKLRDNKSLSSISNLSGKSLSQRVGFLSKALKAQRKPGVLVDYMTETQQGEETGYEVQIREKLKVRKE